MADNQTVKEAINIYKVLIDWVPNCLSFLAIIISVASINKAKKAAKENIFFQSKLDDINQQRHWRREKVYNIADELFELAADYWLSSEESLDNKKRALNIKVRLSDLEENSMSIGLDISTEIRYLQDLITGGDFETSGRISLSPSHDKFISIRQNTQIIKSKLTTHKMV